MKSCIRFALTTDHLNRVREEDVLALRPDILERAVNRFGPERVLDVSDLTSVRDRLRKRIEMSRKLIRLTAWMENESSPYPQCLDRLLVDISFRMLLWSHATLLAAGTRYREIRVSFDVQETSAWKPQSLKYLRYGLFAAAVQYDIDGGNISIEDSPDPALHGGRIAKWKRAFSDGTRIRVGHWLNAPSGGARMMQPAVAGEGVPVPDPGPRAIVLAGVQMTDVLQQGELAECLAEKDPQSFVWLKEEPSEHLEASERLRSRVAEYVPSLLYRDLPGTHFRHWWLGVSSGEAVRASVARAWREIDGLRFREGILRYVLRQICAIDPVSAYSKADRWMRRLAPRVVAGHSAMLGMCAIHAWARRHRVPFVMMPHGFFADASQPDRFGSADVYVHFGPRWVAIFKRSHSVPKPCWVGSGGCMYLATSAPMLTVAEKKHPTVLFLETMDMANMAFYAPTAREYTDWLLAVAEAARMAGVHLLIRGHPRKSVGDFYETICQRARAGGGICSVQAEGSLMEAVGHAVLVVSRQLETSVTQAIMMGIPAVGYNPVRTWPPATNYMRQVASVATTVDQLVQFFKLAVDPVWRLAEWQAQHARLGQLIDTEDVDGHPRIAALLETMASGESPDSVSWLTRIDQIQRDH